MDKSICKLIDLKKLVLTDNSDENRRITKKNAISLRKKGLYVLLFFLKTKSSKVLTTGYCHA